MRVSRTEWHDWYLDAGQSAVFVGDQVIALSDFPTAVLSAVGVATPLATIRSHVEGIFGVIDEAEAEAVLSGVIGELVDAGIVAVDRP